MREWLTDQARRHGLIGPYCCRPKAGQEAGEDLRRWLAQKYHGTMGWMAERVDWRADPEVLWPEACSVLVFAENYGPSEDPMALQDYPERAAISCYARGRDYHDVFKRKLKAIARELAALKDTEVKVFVDTAPIMEKPLAAAAGMGWQGKHTNLVSRELGSWFFLGLIVTTLDIAPDRAEGDHCGSCRACLDICPTNAFPAPYQLDARRCISYLTIEHKGPIPHEFRPRIGNRIYGCDDCLAVCPWNKFAALATEVAYFARLEFQAPKLTDFLALNEEEFRAVFTASPVKRIGYARFLRNVLIAAGNSGLARLVPQVEARLSDPEPLIRGAAIWALGQLDARRLADYAHLSATETDKDTQEEWRWVLLGRDK